VPRDLEKEEGSDAAEPSLEGPVGQTTGNRPLNNQLPVILRLPSKTQDSWFWDLWAGSCVCKISRQVIKNSPVIIQFWTKRQPSG
jgi:hypothetical protein